MKLLSKKSPRRATIKNITVRAAQEGDKYAVFCDVTYSNKKVISYKHKYLNEIDLAGIANTFATHVAKHAAELQVPFNSSWEKVNNKEA